MRYTRFHHAVAAIVLAPFGLWLASAGAQETGTRQTREFAQAAENSDRFEILSAQAALTQSTNPDVRAFAAQMRQDHEKLSRSFRDAARRSGLKPPEIAMSSDQAQLLGALQSVNGRSFDVLYLQQQMLAHRSAFAVQDMYAKSGDDSNLRKLAASAMTLISSHVEMASQVMSKIDAP